MEARPQGRGDDSRTREGRKKSIWDARGGGGRREDRDRRDETKRRLVYVCLGAVGEVRSRKARRWTWRPEEEPERAVEISRYWGDQGGRRRRETRARVEVGSPVTAGSRRWRNGGGRGCRDGGCGGEEASEVDEVSCVSRAQREKTTADEAASLGSLRYST